MTDLSYKNKGFIKSLLIKEPDTNLRTIYKLVKSLNTKEISNESIKQYVNEIRFLQKGGADDIGVCRMVNSDGSSCFINSAIHFLFRIDTFIKLLDSLDEATIKSLKIIDTQEIDNNIKIKEGERDIFYNKVKKYMIEHKLDIQNNILNPDFDFNKIMTDKEFEDYQTLNDEILALENKKQHYCNDKDFENAKILLIIFKNILTEYRKKIINNSNNKTILDLKNLYYEGTRYNVKLRRIIFPLQFLNASNDADEFVTQVNSKILCLSDNENIKNYLNSIKMTDTYSTICENGTNIVNGTNNSYFIKVIPPENDPITMQELFEKEKVEKSDGIFNKCGDISIEDTKKIFIYNKLIDTNFMEELKSQRFKNWQNIDKEIGVIQKSGKFTSKKRNITFDEHNKYIIITVQYMKADLTAKINKNITNFNLEINNVHFTPKAFLLKYGLQNGGHYTALLKVNDKYILANDSQTLLTFNNFPQYNGLNSQVTCILYEKTLVPNKIPTLNPNATIIGHSSIIPQGNSLLQKVSNDLWKPPAGSNNGNNKCWVNAPLYSILSNTDIQQKINNMPEENIDDNVSSNLLSLKQLKSFFIGDLIINLPSIMNLRYFIYKLKIKISNEEEIQLKSLSFNINFKDIDICDKLENTVLNRLHITIFIKSLAEQFSNFFENFKKNEFDPKLNEKIKTLIVEKSNKVIQHFKGYENYLNKYSTLTKEQLQPLYLRALKQFIDNKTPWTNVLYQTFALFIQKYNRVGNIKDKMIYENEFSGADYTIDFIINILKNNKVTNLKYDFISNDIKSENVISIVSTTRCTTKNNGNGGHFISFIKNNDDAWDEVDSLKNFDTVNKFNIKQLKDYHNCTNNKKTNTTRQMLAIIYDQQSSNITELNNDANSGKSLSVLAKKSQPTPVATGTVSVVAPAISPAQPPTQPPAQPPVKTATITAPIPVLPETSTNFSNGTINKFTEGFEKLDNSVKQISQKLATLKQNLNKLKKPMAGGATQKGGANIENDIPIYENILNIVNQEALLKDFISDTYTLLTNLWDPEKNTELKNYLNNNPNDEIQQYFIKDNDNYYFSDVIYTQIMLGQLNSDVYPNTITKNNLTRYYNKKFKK